MKLGFLFNTPFVEYDNKYYSVNLTREFWENRYLHFFDEIVVVGRVKHVKENPEATMARSDMENVKFCCIEEEKGTSSYFGKKVNKFIEETIADCDAVICRNWWGTNVCRKLKKPYMIEVITNVWDSLWYHSNKGKIAAVPNYLLQRRAVRKAPFVLYVSKFFLQEKYPTRGISCGCPDVWLEKPEFEVLNRRINKIRSLGEDCVTLGMIGANSVGYRGHDTLLKAVAKLRKDGTNCRVRFLGGGNPSRWEKMSEDLGISDFVSFDGSLPHGVEVLNWIDDIDILVMPTRAESLGRAVIEAMSRGCPVLGTIETGIREQIGSDCLFHAGDCAAIVQKVEYMISDKSYMEYCAQENFYRSYKYSNAETDRIRNAFYKEFKDYALRAQE